MKISVFDKVTDKPCLLCLKLYKRGKIHYEAIMPLPKLAAVSIYNKGMKICSDCQAAETIVKLKILPEFVMSRQAVANERVEHLRLPKGMSEHMGLMLNGLVKPCSINDLEKHQDWLDSLGIKKKEIEC